MKNMKPVFNACLKSMFYSIAVIISSCTGSGKKVTVNGVTYTSYNVREKDTNYIDINGHKYKHLGNIPDSLRTPSQIKLLNVIKDVLLNGVIVKDNQQILIYTKEQCLGKGLPEHYYEELKNNIRTNNSFNEAYGIKDVAGMKASLDSNLRGLSK